MIAFLFLFFLSSMKCEALSPIVWDEQRALSFLTEEIQKPNFTYCSYNSNLDPPYIQMAGTEKFSHMVILDLLSNCNPFLRNYLIQEIEKAHIEKGLYCFFQEQHLLPPDR